jgi:iron(III) transport system substrate-binding protein
MDRARKLTVALAALLLVGVTACSGADPVTEASPEAADDATQAPDADGDDGGDEGGTTFEALAAEVADLDRDARRERLIELAQEEGGQVTVYTSLNSEILDAAAEAFQEQTGVAMLTYRAGAEDVRTRVLQEAQVDRIGADVLAIGDSRLIPIAEEGILAPYSSPYQEDLVEGSVSELWTAYRVNLYAVAWNTDLVAEGEQPTSYLDLADPAWAGRMTLEPSDYDWYWSVSEHLLEDEGMSQEEVDAYWATLGENADFNSGHTSTRQLLVAGQYAVFASDFSYGIDNEKEAGAPVEWEPAVEPVFATPEAIAAVASTPRPASTLLLMDWLISDGLDVLDEQQIDTTRADLLDAGDLDIRFVDADEWVTVEAEVAEAYDALTGAGG